MPGPTEFEKVAKVGDLGDGEMMSVIAGRIEILLARIGDEYFALDDFCTHADALLDQGTLHADTCEVECPLHEGMFDLRTGQPTSEPVEDATIVFAVRIEGDDILVGPRGDA
jgi:nitrite reductase/ring-hydroxylating ferredoxin subunit